MMMSLRSRRSTSLLDKSLLPSLRSFLRSQSLSSRHWHRMWCSFTLRVTWLVTSLSRSPKTKMMKRSWTTYRRGSSWLAQSWVLLQSLSRIFSKRTMRLSWTSVNITKASKVTSGGPFIYQIKTGSSWRTNRKTNTLARKIQNPKARPQCTLSQRLTTSRP